MIATKETLAASIANALAKVDGNVTMYRLSTIASELTGKRVREQQFYNYRKNGLIKGTVDGKLTKADATTFLTKFVGKRI